MESLQKAQHTLEREVGATFNSHQRVAKGDRFVEEVLKSSTQVEDEPEESTNENVNGLYDVLLASDITATISGEVVTEQRHSGSGASSAAAEEEEETSEVGFSKVSSGEVSSWEFQGHETLRIGSDKLRHQGAPLNASAAKNASAAHEGLTNQHLKIFMADIGPKYNLEIFEALHGLGDLTSVVSFSAE